MKKALIIFLILACGYAAYAYHKKKKGETDPETDRDLRNPDPKKPKKVYTKLTSKQVNSFVQSAIQILPSILYLPKMKVDFLKSLLNLQKESLQAIDKGFWIQYGKSRKQTLSDLVKATQGIGNEPIQMMVISTLDKISTVKP